MSTFNNDNAGTTRKNRITEAFQAAVLHYQHLTLKAEEKLDLCQASEMAYECEAALELFQNRQIQEGPELRHLLEAYRSSLIERGFHFQALKVRQLIGSEAQ
ncbi:hypothetical protein [Microvirga sp. 17 mud 1-3]|uniref:hypothetical protein n=1 Tax=Microvirga sp. 17 mud 1-3 TaxID=2082949 RepID=UPI000D6C1677|nr:hypothetical protein [Microvirga sp. 17 mud 1-3]AWM88640.1 hypothetical protein C4E04_19170 [Microvirga sp. 17 mud 1-3]